VGKIHTERDERDNEQRPVDGSKCGTSFGCVDGSVPVSGQVGIKSKFTDNVPASCFFGEECEGCKPEDVGGDLETEMRPVVVRLRSE